MKYARNVAFSLGILLAVSASATIASAQDAPPTPPPSTTPAAAESSPCDRYGLSTVFRCVGHDLRSVLVTRDSRRWLEAGGVLAGGSLFLDDEVKKSVFEPVTDRTTKIGEQIGAAGWQFGVPTAAYLVARATGHEGAADLSIAIVRTQVVNAIFTRSLKFLPRARPYETAATPAKGSFPSGHASAAFATATVMQRKWGWKAGIPAYAVASFVGATRLENAHFLSDVTFGAALGVASGLAVRLPGPHPPIAPLIAPGKVGLTITIGHPTS